MVVKLLVMVIAALFACGVLVFVMKTISGARQQGSGFLKMLVWLGPLLASLGIAYAAYVLFAVVDPADLKYVVVWLPSAGDAVLSLEVGLLTCLLGIIGNGILTRRS